MLSTKLRGRFEEVDVFDQGPRAKDWGPKTEDEEAREQEPIWVPARAQARAQAGPKPGPSRAQAGPKVGPSQKFGTQKIKKVKIFKIKIRSAQNVGKVWISRKKSSWPHLGPSRPIFCVGRKNKKIALFSLIFAILPVWGPCCYPPEVGQ